MRSSRWSVVQPWSRWTSAGSPQLGGQPPSAPSARAGPSVVTRVVLSVFRPMGMTVTKDHQETPMALSSVPIAPRDPSHRAPGDPRFAHQLAPNTMARSWMTAKGRSLTARCIETLIGARRQADRTHPEAPRVRDSSRGALPL